MRELKERGAPYLRRGEPKMTVQAQAPPTGTRTPPPARSRTPVGGGSPKAPPGGRASHRSRNRSGRYGREPRDGTAGTVNWRTYTSAKDTAGRIGKRCYRLNLERPFDIHCEQSPLVRILRDRVMSGIPVSHALLFRSTASFRFRICKPTHPTSVFRLPQN